jgi:hypothetical protein
MRSRLTFPVAGVGKEKPRRERAGQVTLPPNGGKEGKCLVCREECPKGQYPSGALTSKKSLPIRCGGKVGTASSSLRAWTAARPLSSNGNSL